MEATTFDPSVAVQTLETAKRVNIAAILITLWKKALFPAIDFLMDLVLFPLKLMLADWKITLLFVFMTVFGCFLLVNVSESMNLMNW